VGQPVSWLEGRRRKCWQQAYSSSLRFTVAWRGAVYWAEIATSEVARNGSKARRRNHVQRNNVTRTKLIVQRKRRHRRVVTSQLDKLTDDGWILGALCPFAVIEKLSSLSCWLLQVETSSLISVIVSFPWRFKTVAQRQYDGQAYF